MAARRFSKALLARLDKRHALRVRAGDGPHRFLGIWMVVVGGRLFVRSWNDKPDGWRQGFVREGLGAIELDGREVRVRARAVRGERLLNAIDGAYAERYPHPGSRKYVLGLARPRRRRTTTELFPR